MKVLVLDGNENQAVAAVRSLARAGHRVAVGAATSWSKAGWSRAAAESFIYPAPQQNAAAFVTSIAAQVTPGTLVMPMTERTTLPLSTERAHILAAGGRLVLPSHATVLQAFDKQYTTQLAARLGIATPRTAIIHERAELEAAAQQLGVLAGLPAVLKPSSSEEVTSDGQVRATGAPVYARTADEFRAAYDELRTRCSTVLAQEFIPGGGEGYFALMNHGSLCAEFAHRRIRDVRPTGSGSAVRASARPDPILRAAGLSILQSLNWHGAAMVEFRRRPDGTYVFLEVNGRFWNSLPLAVYAGADFPRWVAELAEHGALHSPTDYQTDVQCRWLLGDLRHLLEVWRGAPSGFPGAFPAFGPTLLNVLKFTPGMRHDNFLLSDPLPELGDWLDFTLRKLPAQFKKTAQRVPQGVPRTAC